MKLLVACDHGGFGLKEALLAHLKTHPELTVVNLGVDAADAVDYPRMAARLCRALLAGEGDRGMLLCGTGIGISMAANRFPGIRAALCHDETTARLSREHNDANVLVLGGRTTGPETARAIVEMWLATPFAGGRHQRRVLQMDPLPKESASMNQTAPTLATVDPELYAAIRGELSRQQDQIELIASENIVSRAVLEAQGSVLTNKYAEGYPHKRYYGGCEWVDKAEDLAIERAKALFGCAYANVQAHSGSQANMAAYMALAEPGSVILGMSLADGGHLTHGSKVSFSGQLYKAVQYGLHPATERIDYDQVQAMAREHQPKVIVAGASAYSRVIDFPRFRAICDEVGAALFVDMAHFAGLVAAGEHPSPFPMADIVTTTNHKTLRGPRGGMILTNREDLIGKINARIFPNLQGGPLMHVIAAKAVALKEALSPEFKVYARQVRANARVLAEELVTGGLRIVSGGTDNHLMLVDLTAMNITGKSAEKALERAGLTCNKNAIPRDPRSPFVTSGIRLGTPAATSRGFGEEEFRAIGQMIVRVLAALAASGGEEGDPAVETAVRDQVTALCQRFPIYVGL